jgi:hypothetical protein
MKKFYPPLFNTALATYKRRWPLKADYLDVPRPIALALIDESVATFGLAPLLARIQFRQLVSLNAQGFDPHDLKEAIEIYINTVNATDRTDEQACGLRKRLENQFGPLHGVMAVRLSGWPFVITPKAAMA